MMRVYCGAFGASACGAEVRRHDAPQASTTTNRAIRDRSIPLMRFIFALFLIALRRTIWTMPTTALAAVAAPQMVARGEDQRRALPIKVFAFDERRRLFISFRHRAWT